jgi:hypothetical protein
MRSTLAGGRRGRYVLAAIMVLVLGERVRAEVREFSATVSSEATELVGGEVTDTNSAFESFPEGTTGALPMTANAGFTHEDETGSVVAEGRAVTVFSDPRLSEAVSPEEFGLSAVAYSVDPSVSYVAKSLSTETRRIAFTPADLGMADGTAIQVQSTFFLDGTLALWTEAGVSDLGSVDAQMTLRVEQTRATTGTTTVLEANLGLVGQADGTAVANAGGALVLDNTVVLSLSDVVTDLGVVHVMFIPQIAIPYSYDATVGEEFTLKATIEVTATDQPDGRGAAVVLGGPLDVLGDLVNDVSESALGDQFADTLDQTAAVANDPLIPFPASDGGIQIIPLSDAGPDGDPFQLLGLFLPTCGLFGVETLVGGAAMGGMTYTMRRRRRK